MGAFLVLIAKVCSVGLPSVGSEDRTICVRLFPQHSAVTGLDQIDFSDGHRTFFIDRIEFPFGEQLGHPSLGGLAYKNDFAMELTGAFEVGSAATYLFEVASDDGFSLKIDGALVGEHRSDRPEGKTVLRAPLSPGRHTMAVSYFQGYGPLGLIVRYKKENSAVWHILGTRTDEFHFLSP